MKVELDFPNSACMVTRDDNDPKYFSTESTFLYHVLQELKKQGYDVIKKGMWRDGHLVDDYKQYIRTRKWSDDVTEKEFCIYNNYYDSVDAGKQFSRDGYFVLGLRWGV